MKMIFDDSAPLHLGWHPQDHQSIIASGAKWSLLSSWVQSPSSAAMSKGYNAVIVTDMADTSGLVNSFDIGVDVANANAAKGRLIAASVNSLAQNVKDELTAAGFTLGGTIHETISEILDHGNV